MAGPLKTGDRIGRFIIEQQLGAGGMGVVYLARDTLVGIQVALKFFSMQQQEPHQLERFKRELLLTRQISHPGICRVFDMHEDDGLLFLSMEYVPGLTLRALLDREQTLPVPRTLEIGCAMCVALAAAHRQGVIHRDLKPGNVIVRERNQVSILDFGLAKGLDMASITEVGVRVGTLNYMASEVLRGEAATERSDIYSVGVILYQCLAGRAPHEGSDVMSLYFALQNRPLPPSAHNLDVTPLLDQVVMRAMAPKPEDRQTDADQLRRELMATLADYPAVAYPLDQEATQDEEPTEDEREIAATSAAARALIAEAGGSGHTDSLPVVSADRGPAVNHAVASPPPAAPAWPAAPVRPGRGSGARWLVAIAGAATAVAAAVAGWLLWTIEPEPVAPEQAMPLPTSTAPQQPDAAVTASDAGTGAIAEQLAEVDQWLQQLRLQQRRRGVIDGDSPELDAELRRLQAFANRGQAAEALLAAQRAHNLLAAIRIDETFVSRKHHRFNAVYDRGHSARNERELKRLADRIIDAIEQQRYPHANRLLNVAIELAGQP